MADVADILDAAVTRASSGQRAALCAIVATRGSTPQPAGTLLCVDETAQIVGTLGGGCVEADVRRRAHQLLAEQRSELLTFRLDGDFGFDDGMICGGNMDVAVSLLFSSADAAPLGEAAANLRRGSEAVVPLRVSTDGGLVEYRLNIAPSPELIIAGGGHIGRLLAPIMVTLGFRVTVVDDRNEYANDKRFPPPMRTVVGNIAETLADHDAGANTYFVIVTRGHKHDEQALAAVLDSPAKYIGMIGSRRKIKVIFDDLRHGGTTGEQLARVHAPIGLNINAVTAEEIAVSIAAQIISIRRAGHRQLVEGPIPVSDGGT